MLRSLLHGLTALVLCSLLGACVQLPSTEALQRPPRAGIEAYSLTGRITVSQGQQRSMASLDWHHDGQRDEILLSTPLGQGIAELTRDASGARLVTADRGEFSAPDWEELSAKVFGFALPLTLLPRWVLADAPVGATLDAAGRTQHFVVDGWAVNYLDYESPAAYALPQLIEIRRDDIGLRLKIDEWQMVR